MLPKPAEIFERIFFLIVSRITLLPLPFVLLPGRALQRLFFTSSRTAMLSHHLQASETNLQEIITNFPPIIIAWTECCKQQAFTTSAGDISIRQSLLLDAFRLPRCQLWLNASEWRQRTENRTDLLCRKVYLFAACCDYFDVIQQNSVNVIPRHLYLKQNKLLSILKYPL
jgi:hypothetical protein